MSGEFRPSWQPPLDAEGQPRRYRPWLLSVMLLLNGALASQFGYLLGSEGPTMVPGIKLAILWTIPYLLATALAWSDAGQATFALAKGLALGGILVWSPVLFYIALAGSVSPTLDRSDRVEFYVLAAAFLGFHVAMLLLGRAGAIRTQGTSDVKATWTAMWIAGAWFVLTLVA